MSFSLTGFIVLLAIIIGLSLLPAVQTIVAKKVVTYLFEEDNIEFDLEQIAISPFLTVKISGLYLSDQKKDTLLYTKSLEVFVGDWSISPFALKFDSVFLDDTKVYMSVADGDSLSNLQFVIDRFSNDKEDTSQTDYQIDFGSIGITNSFFHWDNFNLPDTGFGVNYDHLAAHEVFAAVQQLQIAPGEISALVSSVSLSEQSGFELSELGTKFTMNDRVIDLDELLIVTPSTRIKGSYAMNHNAYASFSDYINKVEMVAVLDSSFVSSYDLSFFVPQLEGMHESISIDGLYQGTVSSFKMERFALGYGKSTFLVGKADIHGLPEIETTQINLYLTDGYVLRSDLERIPLAPFKASNTLKLPAQLKKWRYAKLYGKYIGTIKNFVADADIVTNVGTIVSDVQVNNNSKRLSYQGNLQLRRVQLGSLLDNQDLNLVSGSMKIRGSGTTIESADVLAKGKVTSIDYKGYRYQAISLDGHFKNGRFDGDLNVDDPLCKFNFDGSLSFLSKRDTYRFKLQMDTLFPAQLGLFQRDSSAFFAGNMDINIIGASIDTSMGTALFSNLIYHEKDSSLFIDTMSVESFVKDSLREIHIVSSLGDISLKGDAVLQGVDQAITKILDNALPTYFKDDYDINKNKGGMVLYANMNENLNEVLSVFVPALSIDSNLVVRASFFLDPPTLNFSVHSEGLTYAGLMVDSFEFNGGFIDSTFHAELIADTVSLNENIRIENLTLVSDFSEDSVNLYLDYYNLGDKTYAGRMNIGGRVNSPTNFGFSIYDAFVEVADSVWRFAPNNYVEIDSNLVKIDKVKVSSYNKFIALNGVIGPNPEDAIRLDFNDLNLSNIGRMLNRSDINLAGTTSGRVISNTTTTSPHVMMNVGIDGLELNDMAIGSGKLISEWNNELARAEVDFDLIRLPDSVIPDTVHSLKLNGYIYPNREENNLDLRLGTQGFYLQSLEPFTESFMDSLDGRITGYIGVSGEFDHTVLQGEFDLVDSRFRVKYLNTTYYAKNEKLRIEEDWFGFDNLKLTDQNGNKASTIATVYHTNFSDINYDVSVYMKDFLVLNTTSKDNDTYYGKGYLTGDVAISGYNQTVFLELDAKTAKRSDFIIPLTGSAEIGQSDFITFVNSDGSVDSIGENKIDLSGIEMTFKLKVDPSTKVRMIFDDVTGDELSARGDGDLKLEINSKGDFGMYGKYRISSGNYSFTFKNLFSKKFDLEEGGTISWNGDPLNADMNVTAIYNVRAPLGEILNDSTMTTKVNNELLMKMSDRLSEPQIDFDIRLPNASPGIAQQVKSQMSTPEEVNKQVFSLLLFNHYSPPQSGLSASGVGQATSSDLISNQLNNWIAKLDNQLFDLGVNEVKSGEVEIALSKKLLDDRLILESNVGVNRSDEATQNTESQGQFVGDFKLEYLITENGKVRGKVFNRTENRSSIETQDGANAQTQGIGIVLREDFNSTAELWRKMFNNQQRKDKRKRKKAEKKRNKAIKEE